MSRTLGVLIVLFIGSNLFAQQDPKAKEILDTVTKKTQAYKSIEATFSFEMENAVQKISETHNGSIILKGNKYKVILDQFGVEILTDGKNIWTYNKDANEVNISAFNGEKDDLMEPSKVFTIYQNGFDYKFVEEKKVGGKNLYFIDLLPQTKDMAYSNIRVSIDKDKLLICCAQMKGKDGNSYTVSVDQFKTDKIYEDSFFVFDPKKYPNIEVVDNR